MPRALIALGSNLGDRAAQLRDALAALHRAPRTRIVARSAWHETPPIGGPGGQGPFLNGAVLAATDLEPATLLAELVHIENALGRVRTERWVARTVDLDVLLYDNIELNSSRLDLPHPRMHYRHFVLRPAAEVAPGMVHPESGWTIAQLLAHLEQRPRAVHVAGCDPGAVRELRESLRADDWAKAAQLAVGERSSDAAAPPSGLLLAIAPAGSDRSQLRKMLRLPATGPVVWLEPGNADDELAHAARTAIVSAWPDLAVGGTTD